MRLTYLVAIALLCGLLLWAVENWSQRASSQELSLYSADLPLDATLLRLDKKALDEAYEDQLRKLFSVWVSSQAKDPTMISNGLQIARRAYREAAAQIARREQQLLERPTP